MRKRRKVLLQFVRGTARWNEMNLVEIEFPVGSSSNGQMAVMNRVERSAEERDAAWMMFCGGALRLRGRQ